MCCAVVYEIQCNKHKNKNKTKSILLLKKRYIIYFIKVNILCVQYVYELCCLEFFLNHKYIASSLKIAFGSIAFARFVFKNFYISIL